MAQNEPFETDEEFRKVVRRQFDRRDADHLPIRLEFQGEQHEGTLEDISQNGVRIQCEEELPSRGTIRVHIPYKDKDGKDMHLTGVIRWTKQITEAGIELTSKTRDL